MDRLSTYTKGLKLSVSDRYNNLDSEVNVILWFDFNGAHHQ